MKPIYYVGLGVIGLIGVALVWPKPKLTIHFQPTPSPLPPAPPPAPAPALQRTAIALQNPVLETHLMPSDASQLMILPNTAPGDRVVVLQGNIPAQPHEQHTIGWAKIQTKDGSIGFVPIEQLSQIS